MLRPQPFARLARSSSTSAWPSKTHLRAAPTLPPPLPALYPQKIVLSDGSTFTSYTSAPTPAIVRLTRDVRNNPLWAPGTEKRGVGEDGEGRVGRFRRRFEGVAEVEQDASEGGEGKGEGEKAEGKKAAAAAFAEADLGWMSEGAKEEKVSDKMKGGPKAKGGKKK
ncbi:hypothetical protein Q5752_004802 [Cryptotrichosporon argae]